MLRLLQTNSERIGLKRSLGVVLELAFVAESHVALWRQLW
jgi:hypothetical protein